MDKAGGYGLVNESLEEKQARFFSMRA